MKKLANLDLNLIIKILCNSSMAVGAMKTHINTKIKITIRKIKNLYENLVMTKIMKAIMKKRIKF